MRDDIEGVEIRMLQIEKRIKRIEKALYEVVKQVAFLTTGQEIEPVNYARFKQPPDPRD